MDEDREIEDIREKKKRELKERKGSSSTDEREAKKREAEKKEILRDNLTESARQRIENVRLVDKDKAEKVEDTVVRLSRADRLDAKITEEDMKEILSEMEEDQDYNIKRR